MVNNATLQPLTEVFFFPYNQNTEVREQYWKWWSCNEYLFAFFFGLNHQLQAFEKSLHIWILLKRLADCAAIRSEIISRRMGIISTLHETFVEVHLCSQNCKLWNSGKYSLFCKAILWKSLHFILPVILSLGLELDAH